MNRKPHAQPVSQIILAAQHEAAHAVMRKICRLKATRLSVDSDGGGYCEGSGERIKPEENLLVTLAEMAWETGCRFTLLDWENVRFSFVDAGEAWQIVTDFPHLCYSINQADEFIIQEPTDALQRWFNIAGDMLKPHRRVIRRIGDALQLNGFLSASQTASFLRNTPRKAAL